MAEFMRLFNDAPFFSYLFYVQDKILHLSLGRCFLIADKNCARTSSPSQSFNTTVSHFCTTSFFESCIKYSCYYHPSDNTRWDQSRSRSLSISSAVTHLNLLYLLMEFFWINCHANINHLVLHTHQCCTLSASFSEPISLYDI